METSKKRTRHGRVRHNNLKGKILVYTHSGTRQRVAGVCDSQDEADLLVARLWRLKPHSGPSGLASSGRRDELPNETRSQFASNDRLFRKACELAQLNPTGRQASKWHSHKGLAYAHKQEAHKAILKEGPLT